MANRKKLLGIRLGGPVFSSTSPMSLIIIGATQMWCIYNATVAKYKFLQYYFWKHLTICALARDNTKLFVNRSRVTKNSNLWNPWKLKEKSEKTCINKDFHLLSL